MRSAAVEGLGHPEAVSALEDRFEREPDPTLRQAIAQKLALIRGL